MAMILDCPVPPESTGQRIRRLRKARGLTMRELAAQIGVAHTTVQRAEDDCAIYAHTLDALATGLAVGVGYLWNGRSS